jgi:hypothetical protein
VATAIVVRIDTQGLPEISDVAEILADLAILDEACKSTIWGSASRDPAQLQTSVSQVVIGSVLVELLANPDTPAAALYVSLFIAVVTGSPALAALPHKVRERYYASAARAEAARQALERLRSKGEVTAQEGSVTRNRHTNRRQPSQSRRKSRG